MNSLLSVKNWETRLQERSPVACGRHDGPSGGTCRSLSFVLLRQSPHTCPALGMELGEAQACLSECVSKPTTPPGPGGANGRGAARHQGAGTPAPCPGPSAGRCLPPPERDRPTRPVSRAGRGRGAPVPPSPLQHHRGQGRGLEQRPPAPCSGLGPLQPTAPL